MERTDKNAATIDVTVREDSQGASFFVLATLDGAHRRGLEKRDSASNSNIGSRLYRFSVAAFINTFLGRRQH